MQFVCSYIFIDTSHIAVLFNSLDDWNPDTAHERSPDTIGIYRIQEERGLLVGRVATLQLPRLAEASMILNSSVPSSPIPPPSAAFWPDPEQRIVVLRFRVSHSSVSSPPNVIMRVLRPNHHGTPNGTGPYGALLVIPCITFHKHIERIRVDAANIRTPIPWEDWGMCGSVLVPDESLVAQQHYGQPTKFVFPFGSRVTFSRSSSLDGGPRLVTLDTNPLAKLHPPHPGCTRRDALTSVEKTNECGVSSSLKTTHPCSYYFGPHFSDVQHTLAITQNASGYGVLVSLPYDSAVHDELLTLIFW